MEIIVTNQDEMLSRSYRTKIDIAVALDRLCQSQTFSKISVEMVAKKAGISRSSFYYHFSDKNSVVKWLSLQLYLQGIDQTGRTLTWFEGHLITTKNFQQFRSLFVAAACSDSYSAGRPFFIRHRKEVLCQTITEFKHMELTPQLLFQIEALSNVEGIMANYYEEGRYDFSIKEFCNHMVSIVPRELYEALEKPIRRKESKAGLFMTR